MKKSNILLKEIIEKINEDKNILAVILFGSYARKEKYRDIDICLVLFKKLNNLEMSKKRQDYLSISKSKIDIQIFQQLPLFIRKRILKEGKIILSKNEDKLYEIAIQTIKEFEFYKKYYFQYLNNMEMK